MAPGVASKFLVASVLLLAPGATAPPPRRHAVVRAHAPEGAVGHFAPVNASLGGALKDTSAGRLLGEITVLRGEMNSTHPQGELSGEMAGLDKQLEELARMLSALQDQEHRQHRENVDSHANIQVEIDRLREAVRRIEQSNQGGGPALTPQGSSGGASPDGAADIHTGSPQDDASGGSAAGASGGTQAGSGGAPDRTQAGAGGDVDTAQGPGAPAQGSGAATGVVADEAYGEPSAAAGSASAAGPAGGADRADQVDVDMAMPYGDLEPFGREDTAQELTEDSIRQSNEMVDQLERAEVAEEKRAVFRALTRLRGAAVTSYDGIARSQTGNIDDYARKNQWRTAHPVHHLADEEADVAKWAFPDSAED